MCIRPVESTVSPCAAYTSDPAVGGSACVDLRVRMEIASTLGTCVFFLHIGTVCAGASQT